MSDGCGSNRRTLLRLSPEAAAEQEREAVVLFLKAEAANVRRMIGRQVTARDQLSADEAELLAHRLTTCAGKIDAGLHLA